MRREQLVAAAARAVRDRGLADLRVADVAENAGVVRGSVHYHFPDLSELLTEVYMHAVERFCTARIEAAARLDDARDKVATTARAGIMWNRDDDLVDVLYEFTTAVRKSPTFPVVMETLFDRQVSMYAAILEIGRGQGHFVLTAPALDIAANLVSLEDGYGLQILGGSKVMTPHRALGLILSYARDATGCADLVPERAGPSHRA